MSLYGVPADFATGMELVDAEELKTWRVGSRLVYALLIEAHYPGHKDGVPVFLDMIKNLGKYIEDENSIQIKDTVKMFDLTVKDNKPNLLRHILNNPDIPNSNYTENIAKKSLKQAIRVGSMEILDYLIHENVQIIENIKDEDDNKNKYDDIRSLIFNILQSVRIGYNAQKMNNLLIANKFWSYLAKSLYDVYNTKDTEEIKQGNDDKDIEKDEVLLKYTDDDNMDDELSMMRYSKFIISNPMIICSIFKYIHSSLSGKHYINKLKPVLHFICEHYMTLDDKDDLESLHKKCENDKLFDCLSLKPFNIKYGHALLQEYGKTKPKRNVKLFWTEYILIKLVNDYLGIDPNKINTAKRMDQYGNLNINTKDNAERNEMIYCIRYIVSNGAAHHYDDVLLPLLTDYEKKFIKSDDDKKEMNHLFEAMKYGKNIWTLKQLPSNEMLKLFENICNRQIELPSQLISFIISFVVL